MKLPSLALAAPLPTGATVAFAPSAAAQGAEPPLCMNMIGAPVTCTFYAAGLACRLLGIRCAAGGPTPLLP